MVSVLSLICPKRDKRMSRIESDVNVAGADPSNVNTTTTMNIADIPVIDDETSPMEEPISRLDQPMKADEDETSEEDEDIDLKRLQANQKQIVASMEENDDDEEEDEEEQGGNDVSLTTRRHPSLSRVFEEQEDYNEEFQKQIDGQQQEIIHRNWDDHFVLKPQVEASRSLTTVYDYSRP
jgi:vacuolar-type H+-ATPase subunit I/STV1